MLGLSDKGLSLPGMWQKSRTADAVAALQAMPGLGQSPLTRELAIRLLLTPANLPADAAATPALAKEFWQARLAALLRLEAAGALASLLESVPEKQRDSAWYGAAMRRHLMAGEPQQSCEAMAKMEGTPEETMPEMAVFCAALEGRFDAVAQTITAMREAGQEIPNWMKFLVLELGNKPLPDDADYGTPGLTALAMLLASGADELPISGLPPEADKMPAFVSRHGRLPTTDRLKAAEHALETGHAEAAIYAPLVEALPEGVEALAPGRLSLKEESPLYRARIWRGMKQLYMTEDIVSGLTSVFAYYRAHGRMPLASMVYENEVVELSRAIFRKHHFSRFAPDAFAVLFARGHMNDARLWLDVAVSQGGGAALSAGAPLWRGVMDIFTTYAKGRGLKPGSVMLPDPRLGLKPGSEAVWQWAGAMAEGLRLGLPPGYWELVPALPPVFSEDLAKIERLDAEGRQAEALLAIVNLAQPDLRALSPSGLRLVMRVLSKYNLEGIGIRLAHEVLAMQLLVSPPGDVSPEEVGDDPEAEEPTGEVKEQPSSEPVAPDA
jgi:hypothetical protein